MNIECYKRNPTAFLEEYCGVKLLPHQKALIDKMYNAPKSIITFLQEGVILEV